MLLNLINGAIKEEDYFKALFTLKQLLLHHLKLHDVANEAHVGVILQVVNGGVKYLLLFLAGCEEEAE